MATIRQLSFAGGEVSPSVYQRPDQVKYATGLRTCRNFIVTKHGSLDSRAGTRYICDAGDSTRRVRLIPFIYNSDQTFVIEMGHQYIRFIKNGARVLEAPKLLNNVVALNPLEFQTTTAHGLSSGDEIFVSVTGMREIHERNFKILVTGANLFKMKYLDGTFVNATTFEAFVSGTVARVYTVVSPYDENDLFNITYVQSADVVTFAHPGYAPRNLSRIADTNWTLSTITLGPTTVPPNGGSASGPAGANSYRYRVTAIDGTTREESLTGKEQTRAISGATQANPVSITTAVSHNYSTDDEVYITGVGGMTQLNGNTYVITVTGINTFTLNGINGTGYTAYTSGGTAARTYVRVNSVATPTTSAPVTITFPLVAGASEYNVYKNESGIYGFLGIAGPGSGGTSATFNDVGLSPDSSDTPPTSRSLFDATDKYPSAVAYYQQRRVFANTNDEPETVYASRTGKFINYTVSNPTQDDDAVTFSLVGRQVNAIKHMIDLGGLILFTTGGEWQAKGNASGIVVPGEVNPQQISYNGSGTVAPLIVGNTALYLQARGSIIRDLGFDYQIDGYQGNDLTIFASHLFEGHEVVDWAHQQIPNSIAWVVRDDGVLLGLTYVREHQIAAWHRHDFAGTVESVCTIPEGGEDSLYLVIRRYINGGYSRHIERMSTRLVDDVREYDGLDCSDYYDGRNTNPSTTMTLTGGTLWDTTETLTLTATSAVFNSSNLPNEVHLYHTDGSVIRLIVQAFSSTTAVTVKPHLTIPVALRGVATNDWGLAYSSIRGLWHLEGEDVSVLGDGFVVANPLNSSMTVRTVSGGVVTLDKAYVVIRVGLPFVSDIVTLDVDSGQGETVMDKKKFTGKVAISVKSSRGVFAGTEVPPSDDSIDGLYELKIRSGEDYDMPIDLATEVVEISVQPSWNKHGRVVVRQIDPLPLSILGIASAGLVPFGGG